MSLVHLSSVGQAPNAFYNQFPNGIQLGSDAEVCLVGYSGQLNGEYNVDTGEVYEIAINAGQNDTMAYQHADLTATGSDKRLYYAPQTVKIQPGIYSPPALAAHMTLMLNISERITQHKNQWLCTYTAATYLMDITCSSARPPPGYIGGNFVNYAGGSIGVVNAALTSTLTPNMGGVTGNNYSFLDTLPCYLGDTQQPPASIVPAGIKMEFTTIAATVAADVGYSLCYVPDKMATKMKYEAGGEEDYPDFGALEYNNGETNPRNDFAYSQSGAQQYGYAPHGMCISSASGEIGIIQAQTGHVTGDPKNPEFWDINWTGVNINLAAPGLKKLAICPRQSAGAVNVGYPIIEYLYDNGGGWTVLATQEIDGPRALPNGKIVTYHYAQNYFAGIVINPITANRVTSLPITFEKTDDPAVGPLLDGNESLELAFKPYDDLQAISELVDRGGMMATARACNGLGLALGFPESYETSITPATVGYDAGLMGALITNGEFSSLLITCPSLPITGYIGGAMGSTSTLLGVGRVRGNAIEYGFSGEVAENWIQLRNTKPLSLYRLKIELKTESNDDYIGLEPNFTCWIKFRSKASHIHLKSADVMGVIGN